MCTVQEWNCTSSYTIYWAEQLSIWAFRGTDIASRDNHSYYDDGRDDRDIDDESMVNRKILTMKIGKKKKTGEMRHTN